MKTFFNLQKLSEEPGVVRISLNSAMLCIRCRQVSNSKKHRCTSCKAAELIRLVDVLDLPQGPPPEPAAAMGKVLPFAA